MTTTFDFHGVVVALEAADADVRERLRRDFEFFESEPASARLRFEVSLGAPPSPARGWPSLRRPGFEAFDLGPLRRIDYRGEAGASWDYERREGVIVGATRELAHELAHLAILSRVGEELDRRGLHRVHALGVSSGARAALLLLESGGGKSVLAMQILRASSLGLLSDDTPLVDAAGRVLPFPLCVGLLSAEHARGVPREFLREFPRRGRPTKTTVAPGFFSGRVCAEAAASALLLGRRGAGPPRMVRASRARALGALVDGMVVGRGVAQMAEYVLRLERGHLRLWGGIALSRLRAAARLAWSVPAYDFILSGDARADARELELFLSGAADS